MTATVHDFTNGRAITPEPEGDTGKNPWLY